ncbi:MAG: GumC family protein [Planctomycetota bacterium]|jgi:capsular exopolysaccharide synthesis family protein
MAEQIQNQMASGRLISARPRTAAPAVTLTPKEILGILRRHIWLMVFFTILGFILSGVSWYLMKKYFPKYTAATYIKVLPPVEKDPTRIMSPQVSKDIQYGYRVSLASLIKSQSNLQKLIDRDKIQETDWFQHFSKIKDRRITKAVRDLKKRMGAGAQRDGEFIAISMRCGDREESALIVNEMVDLFVASQGATQKAEVTAKLAGLRNEHESLQKELAYAEKTLDDIRRTSKFTDLDEHSFQDAITMRLARLEIDQSEQSQEIKQLQTTVAILKRQDASPIDEQIENEVERDPTTIMLTQQLAVQEASLAGRLARFGENHRVVRQIQEMISETRRKKQERKNEIAIQTRKANLINAQNQLIVLQGNLEELEKLRNETAARKSELDLARVRYERGLTVREEIQTRLEDLQTQITKMTIIADDPETPKVLKVGPAPVPLEVSSPLWYIYLPGGTILGLMAGIGLAFLIELANDLVRTPRDVGRYLHIPLLGIIPDAAEDQQLRNIDFYHVVRQAPYSIVSESYRRFRNNLKLSSSASAQSQNVFLISSGMAGDGKTSVAVNLATTLVAERKKVLLIDANFWRPSIHKLFRKPEDQGTPSAEHSEFGLSTVLTGLAGHQEVIRSTGLEGFDIIDSGQLPSNPGELISSSQMQELLKQQRQTYDYVIVDGAPVLLVSDVKALARLVDTTILVFNANTTRRGAASRAIRELNDVDASLAGCVLFTVKAMKGGYFQEQLKSYKEYQKLQFARSP